MRPFTKISSSLRRPQLLSGLLDECYHVRHVHSSYQKAAVAHPINVRGPPPKAPAPVSEYAEQFERIERQKRQADVIQQDSHQRTKSSSPLKKRFWKDVNVREVPDGYQVFLDSRPVRTAQKSILTIPRSKAHLAHAIALEWDLLTSAQQALKYHLIPLTSTTARAEDIVLQESRNQSTTRDEIISTLMRYLETDTLLSWASESNHGLRDLQIRTAQPIISHLATKVWPGVEITPTFESDSIMPVPQPEATRNVIRGWLSGLHPYDLAGLERATLASKSLIIGAQLVVEWSSNFEHLRSGNAKREFGIEQAAEASSLEVRWQTEKWGEVEDTHDVEREDLKRQLGSVILLVSEEKW